MLYPLPLFFCCSSFIYFLSINGSGTSQLLPFLGIAWRVKHPACDKGQHGASIATSHYTLVIESCTPQSQAGTCNFRPLLLLLSNVVMSSCGFHIWKQILLVSQHSALLSFFHSVSNVTMPIIVTLFFHSYFHGYGDC